MNRTWALTTMAAMAAAIAGGCAMLEEANQGQQVTLVGANEVPPVSTTSQGPPRTQDRPPQAGGGPGRTGLGQPEVLVLGGQPIRRAPW